MSKQTQIAAFKRVMKSARPDIQGFMSKNGRTFLTNGVILFAGKIPEYIPKAKNNSKSEYLLKELDHAIETAKDNYSITISMSDIKNKIIQLKEDIVRYKSPLPLERACETIDSGLFFLPNGTAADTACNVVFLKTVCELFDGKRFKLTPTGGEKRRSDISPILITCDGSEYKALLMPRTYKTKQ